MGGVRCAVLGCNNAMVNQKSLIYHRFPKQEDRCIEWLKMCGRIDLLNTPIETIYKNIRICSDHFKCNAYSNPEKTRLLPKAFPTVFGML